MVGARGLIDTPRVVEQLYTGEGKGRYRRRVRVAPAGGGGGGGVSRPPAAPTAQTRPKQRVHWARPRARLSTRLRRRAQRGRVLIAAAAATAHGLRVRAPREMKCTGRNRLHGPPVARHGSARVLPSSSLLCASGRRVRAKHHRYQPSARVKHHLGSSTGSVKPAPTDRTCSGSMNRLLELLGAQPSNRERKQWCTRDTHTRERQSRPLYPPSLDEAVRHEAVISLYEAALRVQTLEPCRARRPT